MGLEPLMARIRDDAKKRATVEGVRAEMPSLPPLQRAQLLDSLPRICPALEAYKRRSGETEMRYNGIVLLEINDLKSREEIADIKQRAATWPTTLAAMTGTSGKSVKILVRGTFNDGSLPSSSDETARFHALLYERCATAYASVVGRPFKSKNARPNDTLRWTWDSTAFYNADASPLRIAPHDLATQTGLDADNSKEYDPQAITPSEENYRLYAMRFALAVRSMREQFGIQEGASEKGDSKESTSYGGGSKKADNSVEGKGAHNGGERKQGGSGAEGETPNSELQLAAIAEACLRLGIPLEETLRQAHFWIITHLDNRERARTIVESTYLSHPQWLGKDRSHGLQELTMQLQQFMKERYDLRYNELSNSVEWRSNHSASYTFRPLDTRMMNTMIQEAHENGIEVFDRDMRRYLGSTRVRSFNPAAAYLRSVEGRWDKRTDYIGALADRVPNRNPHWREWFHTWFLSLVAQWEGLNYSHGNAVVPLLIGQQGCGKSTFGQFIPPPELRSDGYRELVDFSKKTEVERMLATSLLINLDEFNQISEKIQQGFLKNLLQKSSVKTRRPYSASVSEEPRLASFIATTNMNDVLSDPSGSRRFIVAEIREGQQIDLRGGIPYEQLYAQAYEELYHQHRRSYFTPEEVQQIETYNNTFATQRPEVEYLLDIFKLVPQDEEGCEWLSSTELALEVRRQTHYEYSNSALNYLGRWLTAENRFRRVGKKTLHGISVYSVRRRKR